MESNPREKTAVDFRETAEGMRGRKYTIRNAFGKKKNKWPWKQDTTSKSHAGVK